MIKYSKVNTIIQREIYVATLVRVTCLLGASLIHSIIYQNDFGKLTLKNKQREQTVIICLYFLSKIELVSQHKRFGESYQDFHRNQDN